MKAEGKCRRVKLREKHPPHKWTGTRNTWQCPGYDPKTAAEQERRAKDIILASLNDSFSDEWFQWDDDERRTLREWAGS